MVKHYKSRVKGGLLLETVIALSLTTFIIYSFASYTLKMKHIKQEAEFEINFSNSLAVLSERMYQCKNKPLIVHNWQKENEGMLKLVSMDIKATSPLYKIEFRIANQDEVRTFFL